MKRLWIALVLFLSLSTLGADSPRTVTLAEAIAAAEENSISLESARITLEGAIRRQNAVMTTFMPSLSLNAGLSTGAAFPGQSATGSGETYELTKATFSGLTVSAGASASFSFTGDMITDGDSRKLQKESAQLSYDGQWSSIKEAVTTAYINIAAQDSAIESASLSLDDTRLQYESAKEMYENGLCDELTLRQSELALRNAELSLKTLEDSKTIMMSAFRNLTGIEGEFEVASFEGGQVLSLPSPEDLFNLYSETTVDVRSARNVLAQSELAVTTAKLSAYMPVITAGINYNYGGSGYAYVNEAFQEYSNSTHALTGSVSVSIPISSMLPGSATSEAIKDAEDNVRLSSLSLQDTKDNLLETIRQDVISIEQYQATIDMYKASVETARRTYELAQDSFNNGLMTADELAASRTSLLSTELSLLSTELSHLQSCYDLSYVLNIDISVLLDNYASIEETI